MISVTVLTPRQRLRQAHWLDWREDLQAFLALPGRESGSTPLTEKAAISVAVLSRSQDDVELVNSTLRDGGHPAQCHWIQTPGRFADVLSKQALDLVILNTDEYVDSIRQVIKDKEPYCPEVPVIAIAGKVSEDAILHAMKNGACDLVSSGQRARLHAVVRRELRASRVERALNATLTSATQYRRQLQQYMENSNVAIANVQEGIVTEVNRAWLKLFQAKESGELVGLPLMDSFSNECHAAVKGALIATMRGKWQPGEVLAAKSSVGDGVDLELTFENVELDDGKHVQIRIAPQVKPVEEPTKLVHDALKRDPTTLFFHRAQFLDRLRKRLARRPKSGTHILAFVKLDNFSEIRKTVGIIDSEEVLAQFAEEMRKRLHPRDVAGRFEGTVLMTLLERGNDRDGAAWGRQLVDHIGSHSFKVGEQKVAVTCTVGVVGASGAFASLEELIAAAADAHAQAKSDGGNTVRLNVSNDVDTKLRRYDELWVKRIKAALMEKRFRLAQLPIAGLRDDAAGMYDMLIRMIDEQGETVIPSEFLPAAERNNLMKTIDRWMLSASLEFCKDSDAECAFVRVSRQSIKDQGLAEWLKSELEKHGTPASNLVVQIPEQEAARFIKETKSMADRLRILGVGFALEHYGVDKNRLQILDILKPSFIKIDGELMHSLMTDTALQKSVRKLTQAASERKIGTIAERVENANEMAVLFQLGVNYMQGHYVHEPEVVLQERVATTTTTLDAIGNS